MANLTAERLKELYSYDRETGLFTRLTSRNGSLAGSVCNRVSAEGYVVFSVDGRPYKAHRLAWLYETGAWPKFQIDHKDGCRSNNRINNLREASGSQNKANEKLRKDNSSGFKGAKPHYGGKWQARIGINGKRVSLGYYATAAEAHEAYLAAARREFGEFVRSA
jgi:hypothetical protein